MRRSLALLALLVMSHAAAAADVLTSRGDLSRTGTNDRETAFALAAVNDTRFGQLWTLYADGQVVAQPLYVSQLAIDTSGNPSAPLVRGTFNTVFVATMHNTVYGYDADRAETGADGRTVPLWATWLGPPRPSDKSIDMYSTNDPEWGILSTPVIDSSKTLIYVVAWHDLGNQSYEYRLHALRLKDGAHAMKPMPLQAPALNVKQHKQRAGLALAGGVVYIAFGGDDNHGLVLAHDATTLAQRAVWNVTPTGKEGGLWNSGQAPAVDSEGNLYVMTGDGSFSAHKGGADYGDSFVKLKLEGNTLVVKDSFTPCNESYLFGKDMDLGSAGAVLIAGSRLVIGGGKDGHLYALSMDKLGGHVPPPQPQAEHCPNPNARQDVHAAEGHLHGSPVFWRAQDGARIYLWGENDRLKMFRFNAGKIDPKPQLGPHRPPPPDGMPGGMLSLSSNGGNDAILWALVPLDGDANTQRGVKAVLLAYDARDISKVLWSSEHRGKRDRVGLFAKYVPPTIAGGKVFVATYGDDERRFSYVGNARPADFPQRYYVAVYGEIPFDPVHAVNQGAGDIRVVTARTGNAIVLDTKACEPRTAGLLDCAAELERDAGAPSLGTVLVAPGYDFAGCQVLRVTTAIKASAIAALNGIGFYAADTAPAQFGANHGRTVRRDKLKSVGKAVLKTGEPAVLHEFASLVNCELAPGIRRGIQMKPYAEFVQGDTMTRNWEDLQGNYAIDVTTPPIDRTSVVLQ